MKGIIGKMLGESRDVSSIRVLMTMVMAISSALVWGVWLYASVKTGTIAEIPPGVSTTYLAVNAACVSGKVIQKFAEKEPGA